MYEAFILFVILKVPGVLDLYFSFIVFTLVDRISCR